VQSTDLDVDHIPSDLVHHFLLAISTRPGTGICFKDRGWYPRETDPDDVALKEDDTIKRTGRIYNRILANVLKTLKVNEDSRQQELAIKILEACPELVAGFASSI
jgi:nucleolar pre-ribosomal-associated protein 1